MIRQPLDYAEDERQQRVSNSQPLVIPGWVYLVAAIPIALVYANWRRMWRWLRSDEPISDWWRMFIGWAGAFIVCGLFWGFVLGKIFGR